MSRALCLATLLAISAGAAWAAPPSYRVTRRVALGAPQGWDYLTFDPATGHVLVAHATQTDIVDQRSGRIVGRLAGLRGAHGQVVYPATGEIFADSGQTGTVTVFDPRTLAAVKTLPAGKDADGVVYEPAHHLVVVLDGDGDSATLIDAASKRVTATVKLGGDPEFGAVDGRGGLYVNITSTGEIVRIDTATASVTARFAIPGCDSPHGLAIDPITDRLFTTCLNAKLMVVDAASGKVLQTLAIGHGSDAAAFDPVRRRIFSSNGDGTLSVLQEAADGTVTALGEVKTARGARTMAIDPGTGRIFLVTADVQGETPPSRPGGRPHLIFTPGTVTLLFLDRDPA
jgi:DNA-binding beta-propeller fold protein YncE